MNEPDWIFKDKAGHTIIYREGRTHFLTDDGRFVPKVGEIEEIAATKDWKILKRPETAQV